MFGGNVGPIWPEFKTIFSDASMTAISIAYVSAGFAFAADGRSKWADESTADDVTRTQESDTEQKIFHWKHKHLDFAYALTGMVFNKGKTFNLVSEMATALKTVAELRINNLDDFIEQVCSRVKDSIVTARADGRIERFQGNPLSDNPDSQDLIARIFFIGYRREKPFLKIATFRHKDQIAAEPEIATYSPPPSPVFVGSKIAQLMFQDNDQRFKKYVRHTSMSSSLQDAVAQAKGFIEACCDPIASEIDKACLGIGGHIHVAEITPSGFRWRIPPASLLAEQKKGSDS